MILMRRLPFSTRIALLCALVGLACACGDKKNDKPAAGTKAKNTGATEAKALVPKPAATPAAKVAAKPTLPTLKLAVDKVLLARVLERCAVKGGEPADDALALAADAYAGRVHQVPTAKPVAAAAQKAAKPDGKKGASKSAKAGTKAVVPAVPGELVPDGMKSTTQGRTYVNDAAHKQWVKDYAADVATAEGWPAWKAQMDKDVAACRWAPEFGLIDGKLIDRYTDVFVQITCLQEKHRGPDGNVDDVAHARAAIAVFKANDFDAPGFSRLGLVMARFPKVQATLHAVRAKVCPDPRLKLDGKASQGDYIGTLSGPLRGKLNMTAKDHKLAGTLVLAAGKRSKKAITVALTGTIDGKRLHLNGVTGQDWLRLDCASTQKVCDWSGEIGFKKQKGTWSYKRPPTALAPAGVVAPEPAVDPAATGIPAAAVPAGKPVALPPGTEPSLPAYKAAIPPPDTKAIIPKLVPTPTPVPPADPAPEATK